MKDRLKLEDGIAVIFWNIIGKYAIKAGPVFMKCVLNPAKGAGLNKWGFESRRVITCLKK
ncbi:hypothetical protein D3C81_192830 [compost metagenome]|uniref:Uncharacterized protein n=1 Tax=Paenibacillus stellifer TaxID=169760 RepID=A0A089N788_9BACL|nr:hypothetical protein PSTEL_17595 [Paenibacillus stellifer]